MIDLAKVLNTFSSTGWHLTIKSRIIRSKSFVHSIEDSLFTLRRMQHIHTLINAVMVTTEESTSVMDAVRSSSKTRSSKLTSAKKTVDPGMLLTYVEYRYTHL